MSINDHFLDGLGSVQIILESLKATLKETSILYRVVSSTVSKTALIFCLKWRDSENVSHEIEVSTVIFQTPLSSSTPRLSTEVWEG